MSVTNFLWDGENLLNEYSDLGTSVAHYVTEPHPYGNVISQARGDQSGYFHYDALGSTMELTVESATISDTRRYSSFGSTVEQSGSTILPFLFVGRHGYYYDVDSDTYYVRRRMYSHRLTRWLIADTLGIAVNDSNQYCYVNNRVTRTADPSGLGCKVWYDCVLKTEVKGKLYCTCEYVCIESATKKREPIAGGGFTDCEDPRIPKSITHSHPQFKECAKYLPDIPKFTGEFAGNIRDCRRGKCREDVDKLGKILKESCGLAGEFEQPCKVAAELWIANALGVCEACDKP
jgi:RHS repeat-associated protein